MRTVGLQFITDSDIHKLFSFNSINKNMLLLYIYIINCYTYILGCLIYSQKYALNLECRVNFTNPKA